MVSNERILDYCNMRLNGCTYEEIGKKYKVTPQAVQSTIKFRVFQNKGRYKVLGKIVYPNIAEYMADNRLSMPEFSETIGWSYQATRRFLLGISYPSFGFIDAVMNKTGLSYEDAFKKREGFTNLIK